MQMNDISRFVRGELRQGNADRSGRDREPARGIENAHAIHHLDVRMPVETMDQHGDLMSAFDLGFCQITDMVLYPADDGGIVFVDVKNLQCGRLSLSGAD